jgi:hypothetical protein
MRGVWRAATTDAQKQAITLGCSVLLQNASTADPIQISHSLIAVVFLAISVRPTRCCAWFTQTDYMNRRRSPSSSQSCLRAATYCNLAPACESVVFLLVSELEAHSKNYDAQMPLAVVAHESKCASRPLGFPQTLSLQACFRFCPRSLCVRRWNPLETRFV